MVVVADTSPINYLILIDCIDVLPVLYGRVVIPEEVLNELTSKGAPEAVSLWVESLPEWMEIRQVPERSIPQAIRDLDPGERAAIRLALTEKGSLLLIDESAGRLAADKLGVRNTGTLGVLLVAARAGAVDLGTALAELRRTNFRISQSLIDKLGRLSPK